MRRLKVMTAIGALLLTAQANPHRPTPVVDTAPPSIPASVKPGGVLILSKTNAWRHLEHIPHSNALIADLAKGQRRAAFVTENAAVLDDALLSRFRVIVLNSTTGPFATPAQRAALRRWIERGGGVVALHAAGDGSHDWPWWTDVVIGARFTGHPGGADQFQAAKIDVVAPRHPVMAGVRLPWRPLDEWYAFDRVPTGVTLLATIDEASYRPEPGKRMPVHPVAWTRAVGKGRVVYLALGHTAEAYDDPNFRRMIDNAMRWVAQ